MHSTVPLSDWYGHHSGQFCRIDLDHTAGRLKASCQVLPDATIHTQAILHPSHQHYCCLHHSLHQDWVMVLLSEISLSARSWMDQQGFLLWSSNGNGESAYTEAYNQQAPWAALVNPLTIWGTMIFMGIVEDVDCPACFFFMASASARESRQPAQSAAYARRIEGDFAGTFESLYDRSGLRGTLWQGIVSWIRVSTSSNRALPSTEMRCIQSDLAWGTRKTISDRSHQVNYSEIKLAVEDTSHCPLFAIHALIILNVSLCILPTTFRSLGLGFGRGSSSRASIISIKIIIGQWGQIFNRWWGQIGTWVIHGRFFAPLALAVLLFLATHHEQRTNKGHRVC